jgi:hypothetical protein
MRSRRRTRSAPRASVGQAPILPAAIVTPSRATGPPFRQRRRATTDRLTGGCRRTLASKSRRDPVRVRMDCFPGPRRHAPPRRQHCNLTYSITITGCGPAAKRLVVDFNATSAERTGGIVTFNAVVSSVRRI